MVLAAGLVCGLWSKVLFTLRNIGNVRRLRPMDVHFDYRSMTVLDNDYRFRLRSNNDDENEI